MLHIPRFVSIMSLVVMLVLAGCTQKPAAAPAKSNLALEPLAGRFDQPLLVTHAPGLTDTLFVVEKTGHIRVVVSGTIAPQPLLDLQGQVSRGNEQGLLGLAFHPHFATNGHFFINYTDLRGDTQLVRYQAALGALVADPASRQVLLTIPQPAANHNGGMIAFGPDGYLYMGTGDGGGAGDPRGSGQNRLSLLGKMLRIDVDQGETYGIPADNPFIGHADTRAEIWALGLRNPWRFSFDRLTGDLYIADVGQNAWEEVNRQPGTSSGGENYGWNHMEARHCYRQGNTCFSAAETPFTLPVIEYSHAAMNSCSVTGGYVYRGTEIPALVGSYILGDYCSGRVWIATPKTSNDLWDMSEVLASGLQISSFGEDAHGELYVTDLRGGQVYKIVAGGR